MPTTIPRRPLAARLAVLETLTWMLAVDVFSTAEILMKNGWDDDHLAEALGDCRRWWHEQVDLALDSGLLFFQAAS